jgi:hypothetical protein
MSALTPVLGGGARVTMHTPTQGTEVPDTPAFEGAVKPQRAAGGGSSATHDASCDDDRLRERSVSSLDLGLSGAAPVVAPRLGSLDSAQPGGAVREASQASSSSSASSCSAATVPAEASTLMMAALAAAPAYDAAAATVTGARARTFAEDHAELPAHESYVDVTNVEDADLEVVAQLRGAVSLTARREDLTTVPGSRARAAAVPAGCPPRAPPTPTSWDERSPASSSRASPSAASPLQATGPQQQHLHHHQQQPPKQHQQHQHHFPPRAEIAPSSSSYGRTSRSPPPAARAVSLSREDLESVDVLVSLMLLGRGPSAPPAEARKPAGKGKGRGCRGKGKHPLKSQLQSQQQAKQQQQQQQQQAKQAKQQQQQQQQQVVPTAACAPVGRPRAKSAGAVPARRGSVVRTAADAPHGKRPRASSTAGSETAGKRRRSSTSSQAGPRLHSVATRLGYCACRECVRQIEPTQQRLAYCGSRCQV